MNNILHKYIIGSSLTCGTVKFFELFNAKIKRETGKTTPLLVTEKTSIILLNTILGTYIFPLKIYNKIIEFELYLRNDKLEDYYILEKNKDDYLTHLIF